MNYAIPHSVFAFTNIICNPSLTIVSYARIALESPFANLYNGSR